MALAFSLFSYSGVAHKQPRKIMPRYRLDECDTLFQATIHAEGNTVRLSWLGLPGVTSWIIYRATFADMSDMQIAATAHDTTWLESPAFVASTSRAYYRVAAHWDQGTPSNYRVIEDFDSTFTLQSYSAAQDSYPNAWRPYLDGAFNPNGHCLELYGNTWKREQIDTVRVTSGSVWQVALKCMRVGTLQAFGVADSANEMWYSIWGRRLQDSQAWDVTYQGWYADSQWVLIDLPLGEDWMGRFGYYPLVRKLLFANDNDDSGSAGVLRIDEIRDVTGAISLPPVARFRWTIRSYPAPDTMEVAFCSMGCDPDGPLYQQFWSFGDATTSYENSPVHRYPSHRAYQVTLSIIDTSDRADYVVQQVADTAYTATRQVSSLFTGDVMIARRYEDDGGIIQTWGVDTIFNRVRPLVSSVDLAMCNLECTFTNSNQHHPTKSIYYKGRPEYIEGVQFAGFDFCSQANNHSFDYMVQGMHDTKHLLDSLAILSTGDGDDEEVARQPVFFSKNGLCVAILSFCNRDGTQDNEQPFLSAGPSRPGFAMWNRENIEAMIPAVRQVADVLIVQVHSGIEYATTPPGLSLPEWENADEDNLPPVIMDLLPDTSDVALRKLAIDMGADLVVNHHPHVVEACQVYHGHLIAHSMGNFAFDQQFPETFVSMAIQAQLAGGHRVSNFIINPIFIDRYIPGIASGDLAGAVLDYVADLSRAMNTWTVRQPFADTAIVVMDTLDWHRVGTNFVDTLALTNRDSFAYSAPFLFDGGGYPVSISVQAPTGSQYRVGRELLMWGNIEKEGATPWNLNSSYERYDSVTYHGGQRSIGLNRSGGGSNSVSTNLVYRQVYPLGNNCTISGWMRGQNGRNITLQFEFYDARSGGHFLDSLAIGGAMNGTFNWTRVWQDLIPPDHGYCYDIKARLLSPNTGTGYAWFDDLALVRWESWHTASSTLPFPSNISYVQVRAPLNSISAIVSYRREWAVSNLSPMDDTSIVR